MALLKEFELKLESVDEPQENMKDDDKDDSEKRCQLHSLVNCQSCHDLFGKKTNESDDGWMSHQLKFVEPKVIDSMMRREHPDDLVVIDSRNDHGHRNRHSKSSKSHQLSRTLQKF